LKRILLIVAEPEIFKAERAVAQIAVYWKFVIEIIVVPPVDMSQVFTT